MTMGDTQVLATVSHETKVPAFIRGSGKGWINAEYGMLPASPGHQRLPRERQRAHNRHIEIQRLISRCLRQALPLELIEGLTLHVDCDVLQADGGTRCCSINAALMAIDSFLGHLTAIGTMNRRPTIHWLAAVAVAVGPDLSLQVDPDYRQDASALADINVVSDAQGALIEVQGTGEGSPIPRDVFMEAVDRGIQANLSLITFMQSVQNTQVHP